MWSAGGGSADCSGKSFDGTIAIRTNGASHRYSTTGAPHDRQWPRRAAGGGRYFLNSTWWPGCSLTPPAQKEVTSAYGCLLNAWQMVQWQRSRTSGLPDTSIRDAPQGHAQVCWMATPGA